MPPSEPPVGCGSLLTVGTSGFLGTPRCRYLFCVSWGSMSTFLPSCGDKQRAGRSRSLPHTFVFEAWCLQSGAVKRGAHTLAIGLSQSRRHHTHRSAPHHTGSSQRSTSLPKLKSPCRSIWQRQSTPRTSSASSPGRQSLVTEGQATGLPYSPRHALLQKDTGLV